MAYDKAVDSQALDGALGAVADAIRGKTGRTEPMTLEQMPGEISGIQTGVELPELSNPGSAEDLMEGKELLGPGGLPVVGTFTLDDELAAQGELIEQINAALAPKASGEGGGIPPGWSRCDYIQLTGAQLLDTEIIGNQDTRIRALFCWNDAVQRHLYGCVSADNTASITSYMNGSFRFGAKSTSKTIAKSNQDILYTVDVSRTRIAVTGSSTAISDVEDFETVGTLLLGGARDSDGSMPSVGINAKVAEFWIWGGVVLALHWIPVTDGTAYAFWDTVRRRFFSSITDTPLSGGYW